MSLLPTIINTIQSVLSLVFMEIPIQVIAIDGAAVEIIVLILLSFLFGKYVPKLKKRRIYDHLSCSALHSTVFNIRGDHGLDSENEETFVRSHRGLWTKIVGKTRYAPYRLRLARLRGWSILVQGDCGEVWCSFSYRHKKILSTIRPLVDEVLIEGKIRRISAMDVHLVRCEIVKVKPGGGEESPLTDTGIYSA